MLNLKISSSVKYLIAGAVFVSAFALAQTSVYAVNSGDLVISGKVDSNLAISATNNGAVAFDPSALNTGVKVGELTVTASAASAGLRFAILKSGDLGNATALTLTQVAGTATQNYKIQLQPIASAPALTGSLAANYGSAWTTGVLGSAISGVRYNVLLTIDSEKSLPAATYRDTVVFSLAQI